MCRAVQKNLLRICEVVLCQAVVHWHVCSRVLHPALDLGRVWWGEGCGHGGGGAWWGTLSASGFTLFWSRFAALLCD